MTPSQARKVADDPRWARKCTLMGCTKPTSAHDHHMAFGHLNVNACFCTSQSGEPGSFGVEG